MKPGLAECFTNNLRKKEKTMKLQMVFPGKRTSD